MNNNSRRVPSRARTSLACVISLGLVGLVLPAQAQPAGTTATSPTAAVPPAPPSAPDPATPPRPSPTVSPAPQAPGAAPPASDAETPAPQATQPSPEVNEVGAAAEAPQATRVDGEAAAAERDAQGSAEAAEADAMAAAADGDQAAAAASDEIDLDALLADDTELPGDEYRLNLYGFTDFTFNQPLADQTFLSPYSTFWVGNFNLYIGSELGRNWRTLAEVRFTYLPHGQAPYTDTTQPRIDTHVGDYADYERPLRWGGVEIERAWLEYTANNWLSIRAGQWLTPYGIWNVDHGSPVIVGVVRPYVVGDSLFPERQTGIQLHGGTQLGSTQLGYHLTLSNGRGPIDAYRDLDKNKALGWRLFMRNESAIGALSLGFSGYWGRFTDSLQQYVVDGETFKLDYDVQVQFDELSLAGDIKYEVGDYFLQSEVIANSGRFTDDGRPVVPAFVPGTPNGFAADTNRWGVYGLTGYRTPWLGIMPFGGAEYYRFGTSAFPLTAAWYVGLNVRPIPRVVLKAQYTHSWYPDNEEYDGARLLAFQASWSF